MKSYWLFRLRDGVTISTIKRSDALFGHKFECRSPKVEGRPFLLDQIKTNYNMKTLNISSEQLSDAIDRLWGACRLNGATFSIDPVLGRIFVYNMSHETIATINVIDVTDDYDLADIIFNIS